ALRPRKVPVPADRQRDGPLAAARGISALAVYAERHLVRGAAEEGLLDAIDRIHLPRTRVDRRADALAVVAVIEDELEVPAPLEVRGPARVRSLAEEPRHRGSLARHAEGRIVSPRAGNARHRGSRGRRGLLVTAS